MTGLPYEAPQITDLGSLDDVMGDPAEAAVLVTDDDGHAVAFDTSIGPL